MSLTHIAIKSKDSLTTIMKVHIVYLDNTENTKEKMIARNTEDETKILLPFPSGYVGVLEFQSTTPLFFAYIKSHQFSHLALKCLALASLPIYMPGYFNSNCCLSPESTRNK